MADELLTLTARELYDHQLGELLELIRNEAGAEWSDFPTVGRSPEEKSAVMMEDLFQASRMAFYKPDAPPADRGGEQIARLWWTLGYTAAVAVRKEAR